RGVAATKKTHAEPRKDSQRLPAGKVATKNFAKNAKFYKFVLQRAQSFTKKRKAIAGLYLLPFSG
ncbi:MAG: hypothetical protein ACREOO_14465, partial [bacterium]